MAAAASPLYLDWTFWSFVVAGIAVLLSQLPPIRTYLGKGRLVLENHGAIQLLHMVGYGNAALYISVRNLGRQPVRVVGYRLSFVREEGAPFFLEGAMYFVAPGDKTPVLLVPFTLQPGEEWGHMVTFQVRLERQADRRLGELRAALRRDIEAKIHANRGTEVEGDLVVADDANVQPLLRLFEERFTWKPGEYRLDVQVKTQEHADVNARSRFTLFESDEEELRSYVEDYKFGLGPAVDSERHKGIFPRLTPEVRE